VLFTTMRRPFHRFVNSPTAGPPAVTVAAPHTSISTVATNRRTKGVKENIV
jgi:hypothetical protein